MLEECGLSNTADVAAKLIDEEVSWNDIIEAHGSRGDIGVHNLLNGIVKTGGRAKIVKYLDQAQENAASSGAGGHMGGSSGGSSSSSASSTTSEKVMQRRGACGVRWDELRTGTVIVASSGSWLYTP